MEINYNSIELAKILLNINTSSQTELFEQLESISINDAILETKNIDVVQDVNLIARMIQANYLRLGNEGIASLTIATVAETYIADYPLPILKALKSYRKIKAI